VNNSVEAYRSISGVSVGEIFTFPLSGMAHANISYMARLQRTLSVSGGAGYFMRTDFETPLNQDAYWELKPHSDSPAGERFLGGELFGSLTWAPQSALQITAKAGVFLPGLGGAFISSLKPQWKASLGTTVSF
jgi:hypothetical protein